MFVHFAFGQLGKQGKAREQTARVIESILSQRRLLISPCTEFVPAFPPPATRRIPTEAFKLDKDNEGRQVISAEMNLARLNRLPIAREIDYLPVAVPMICFTHPSFNKLRNSPLQNEYGRLGLVFTDDFLRSSGLRPVAYYSEGSLWNDPLIRKWNTLQFQKRFQEARLLEKEILTYRKPAAYFGSFANQTMMKITTTQEGTKLEHCHKYDRYGIDYDFKAEREFRIAFDEGIDYLCFDDSDLHMVIVPDLDSKARIEGYFSREWTRMPKVFLYPS